MKVLFKREEHRYKDVRSAPAFTTRRVDMVYTTKKIVFAENNSISYLEKYSKIKKSIYLIKLKDII